MLITANMTSIKMITSHAKLHSFILPPVTYCVRHRYHTGVLWLFRRPWTEVTEGDSVSLLIDGAQYRNTWFIDSYEVVTFIKVKHWWIVVFVLPNMSDCLMDAQLWNHDSIDRQGLRDPALKHARVLIGWCRWGVRASAGPSRAVDVLLWMSTKVDSSHSATRVFRQTLCPVTLPLYTRWASMVSVGSGIWCQMWVDFPFGESTSKDYLPSTLHFDLWLQFAFICSRFFCGFFFFF